MTRSGYSRLNFCSYKNGLDTPNPECVVDDHTLIEGDEAQAIFIG
jgi:hypothetical protein